MLPRHRPPCCFAAGSSRAGWIVAIASAVVVSVCSLAAEPLPVDEVAPGVHLVPGTFVPGGQPDGNSVGFVAPAGLVVVDTGRHAEHTDRLLAFARTLERPVIAVVNTPWHLDHIGGNACLRDAFAALCVPTSGAFEGARAGSLARHRSELETAIASGDVAAGDFEAMCAELALLDAASALASDSIVTTAAASARPERRSDPG